jgi:hypothetical protein
LGTKIVLIALAAFGAVMLIDWVLGWLFGLVKVVLLIAVVIGVIMFVARVKSPDDD